MLRKDKRSTRPLGLSFTMRILLVREGALGDILLTRPAVRALRRRYPAADLMAVGPKTRWRLIPEIDEVLDPDGLLPHHLAARAGHPDLTVIWAVHRPAFLPAPDIHVSPYPPPGMHAADWLVRSLGPHADPAPGDLEPASRAHTGAGIYLHPGAGAAWKRWPADRFAELATHLCGVHLIEGPADGNAVAEVLEHIDLPVLRPSSLEDLAQHLRTACLFIGNDSGVTHLAAALGVPTIALFGPTDPVQWAPLGRARVLRRCAAHAGRQGQIRVCDDPTCLAALPVADVLATATEMTVDKDVDDAFREPGA